MAQDRVVSKQGGNSFGFLGDSLTIKLSSRDNDGEYSVIHWRMSEQTDTPIHAHNTSAESFYILNGNLVFVVADDIFHVGPGDFVNIAAGTSHGILNVSGAASDTLVTFTPGGMEEVFLAHRTDRGRPFDRTAYRREAKDRQNTEYAEPTSAYIQRLGLIIPEPPTLR
ncbi:MAG TPA: cupin domain-containing protein [Alphaproteobacteria bacterium]|nr:cupin domain-containing protein [Alphaproteobacteria bacterium]